jgi:hypothetical protein
MNSIFLSALIFFSILSASYSGPLHAQCKVSWTWPKTDCGVPIKALINQIKKWTGPQNCNPPPVTISLVISITNLKGLLGNK